MMGARRLLVLCTGNVCRSPMAQVVLTRTLPGWTVTSAGLAALVGLPAEPDAVAALGERGTDLANFRARQVDEAMLRGAEVVLTMTRGQKEELEARFPWTCGRVFRIGEWERLDIDDPYRRGPEAFVRSLSLIESCVPSWTTRLRALGVAEMKNAY